MPPISRDQEHPAFEMWRRENPIYKLARRQEQSMREYLQSCGYGEGAQLDLNVMPSLKVIQRVADHEGLDTFTLSDRCRTWYALRPDHAWLHHAREVWRRRCPLKVRREEKGWSMPEFAQKSGLHRNTIVNVERHHHLPRVDTLEKMAQTLQTGVVTLLRELRAWQAEKPTDKTAKRYLERVLSGEA